MKKTTKMRRLVLVSAILAMLLLIAGCAFGAPAQNTPVTENVDDSGEVQVSDEDALRKALKSKEDCTVVLSGDIVITEELTVNGNKKLSGGTIIMDRRRVGANESVLAVSKGANLVLDGTTVDGKGVADCITVKAGGTLETVSGSLIYGYPYGLDVSGTVKINDILIDEALHTAVNVAIFGEVDMLGGTISNNLYGIAVAKDARMDMADGVAMTNSYGSFIVNYGDMDIAGGKYIGSSENAIENYGKMSIKGTEEEPIEISGGTKSALNSKNKSTLTAENIRILNMGWHGMCVEKGSTATLKNIYLENAVKSTLYINSSKVKMENVSVIGGQLYAIYATQKAEVEMYDITVKDTQNRGVYVERSTVKIDGITIDGTAKNGIYTTGDGTVAHINNATITNPGTSGIGVAKGEVTVTNSEIGFTTKEGVAVLENGTATLEGVTIKGNGNFAIGNYGGKVTAKNVKIYDTKNVSVKLTEGATFTGSGLNISNSKKNAISVEGGSSATVKNSQIYGTKKAAVNVDKSKLNMTYTVIKNSATYGVAAQNGGKAVLDHIDIYDAGTRAIGSLNGYVVATNIKAYNPGGAGMYTEGADSRFNMANIEVYNAGSCGLGFKGGKEITARNVTIENPKNEGIYAFNGANVKKLDNIVIKNPGSHGISVDGKAIVNVTVDTSFNPQNTAGNGVTIINAGTNGLRAKEGTLTVQNATVTGVKQYGIAAGADGVITVKDCTIENPVEYGINISAGGTVNVSETTITNPGNRGVNSYGKLTVDGLTIDTTKDHGMYLDKVATVEGSGLTVKNVGNNAIFSEGADITVDGLTVANTAKQGVQFKGGTVNLSNIDIKETTNAAVYARNSTKLTLENGIISAYGVGLATTDSAEATVKNVTIEKGTKDGKYSTSALAQLEKTSKIELQSGTKLDGKSQNTDGILVKSATATFTLNGAAFTGNRNDVVLEKNGAAISLNSALTKTLTVKPATYEGGTVIAVKGSDISDADFKASTKLIDVGSETSYVGEDGKLVATAALLNGVSYGSLQDAIDDAVDGDTIKILAEVSTITKTVDKTVKLTADKAVTITVETVKVASGKTLTVEGADADKKITVKSTKTGKDVFYNEGTLNLTNVAVSGGKYAVNNRANATLNMTNVTVANTADNGLHLAGGTTTVTNVTISNTKGHGIGCYSNLVLKPAAEGQTALTITDAKKSGIYMSYDPVMTGYGLVIKNPASAGIFGDKDSKNSTVGANVNISNVTIENTGAQGIQAKLGTVIISDFAINGTGSAALRPYEGAGVKFNLSNGTISTGTYGIMMDSNKQEAVLTNVTIERNETNTDPVVNVAGTAKLELAGTTKVDGKNSGAVGVKVAASGATVTMNGATITGTNTDVELVSGAKITVNSALTSAVSVKMAAYAKGTVVAVKGSGISDADFAASMAKLQPVNTTWKVDDTGCLAYADHVHNYVGVVTKNATCTEAGEKTFTCSICGDSYPESVPALGHTVVHVAEKIPTLEAAGNIEHWYCSVCNTYWKDAENKNVIAKEDVTLPVVAEGNVAYMNGTAYETLEAAVTAANETAGADTVYLLTDVQINSQLKATTDITITAAKAATVTVTDKVTGSVIYVTSGTLTITGASENAKITIAASTSSQSMVKLNGGNVALTNVYLKGNTASIVTVANGNCIQNEKGTLTAKSVTITDSKGDGIRVYAGATANLDNVTISGTGKYGINILGTLNIYNTVHANHALTVSNTKDHGIRVEGTLTSHLNSVPAGTYAMNAENNKGRGVVAVNSGNITISHISVTNSGDCGIEFLNTSGGSVSDFVITTTKKAGINKASGTVSLANGSITTSNVCIQTSDTELTASNITVKRTAEGDALNINGATSFEGITVITE